MSVDSLRSSVVSVFNFELGPKKQIKVVFYYIFPLLVFLFCIILGLIAEGYQQFSLLAEGFVKGHPYFIHPLVYLGQDPVFYKGHVYWDEGPLPAVILTPFVFLFSLFHKFFYQGYIKWAFVFSTVYFIYKLARSFRFTSSDSVTWVFAFTLASVYMGVNSVSSSWLFAQVISTFLLFVFLYEFFTRKRLLLLGTLAGFVFLTRASATPIILIPILDIFFSSFSFKEKARRILLLISPLVFAGFVALGYNFIRFHDIFQNGNKYQLLGTGGQLARGYGVMSLYHIPSNLYTALLQGPVTVLQNPNSWTLRLPLLKNNSYGMSVLLTSPYLLFFLITGWKKYTKEVKILLVSALVSAVLVLSYFGIGADQFGYRYSLDFMPTLFVALMILYREVHARITRGMHVLIVITIISNVYFLISYFS